MGRMSEVWQEQQQQEAERDLEMAAQFHDEELKRQELVEAAKRLCVHAPIKDVKLFTDALGISDIVFK